MSKSPVAVLASAAILGITVALGASPAFASNALPTSNSLYVIDSQGTGIYEMTSDGAQTALNLQSNDVTTGAYWAGALNPLDNRAYLIYEDANATETCAIDSVDMLGGAPLPRIPITNANTIVGCYGFNIDAQGSALLYAADSTDQVFGIWKVDITTGVATDRVVIEGILYGFTVSPSGVWYGITETGSLVTIDQTTGAFSTVVVASLNDAYDCKFDANGTLWFTDNEFDAPPFDLYSWTPTDTDYTLQGNTSIDGDSNNGIVGAIFVGNSTVKIAEIEAAKNALPDTGVDVNGYASLALLLALAGAALVVRRRLARA